MADIVARDVAVGSGRRDAREVNAELTGQRAHGRLGHRLARRDGWRNLLLGRGTFLTTRTAQPTASALLVADAVTHEHRLSVAHLHREDGRTHRHHRTGLHQQRGDATGEGRRQFDDRLGGLDVDDRLVDRNLITDADAPADDLGLGEALTDIGEREFARAHTAVTRSMASSTRSTSGR